MATTRAAKNQKAYRDRERVKRLRNEALFDQVLAAMKVSVVKEPDGSLKVNMGLSKTCPEWKIFEKLADSLGRTPAQLFDQLIRGAVRRYLAGEV